MLYTGIDYIHISLIKIYGEWLIALAVHIIFCYFCFYLIFYYVKTVRSFSITPEH